MKTPIPQLFILLLTVWFASLQNAHAVSPAPDGGYPGGNTAEGQNALFSLTTGGFNTAAGYLSLRSNTTNSFNTAIGAGALLANNGTGADQNTATGTGALLSNTSGNSNTANGAFALFHNTTGNNNTAVGTNALGNTDGNDNTAIGVGALSNIPEGFRNVAVGVNALVNRPGDSNVGLGNNAGFPPTPPTNPHSDNNIYIGYNIRGVADESHTCYIGNIWESNVFDSPLPVFVTMGNKLGTNTSSRRFKTDIKAMDNASDVLFALKPVTFRYKKDIDSANTSQFGLVAEDVEKVSSQLVVHDKEGKPYSVRYDQVNAMLLNEFLKEHRTVQELQGRIGNQEKCFQSKLAEQQKQIEALTAGLQKVSAQFEVSKAAPQTVLNNQ